MRSYFCKKCDLEFDLEEEMETDPSAEEPVSMVFCPNCLVTVAEALPETPERILARERRIRHQEKLRRRKSLKLLLAGAGMLFLASAGFSLAYHSFFWMLVLSLFPGITAGLWTREITSDRTWRAGILALGIYGVLLLLCILIPWSCGKFLFLAPVQNLVAGAVPAWICAVFEK